MTPSPSSHALVVGGTGMLRGVSLALAARGHTVSVVARTSRRLRALAESAGELSGRLHPLALDYHEDARLRAALAAAVDAHGPLALAVCWIHSSAQRALFTVAEVPGGTNAPCRLFRLRGSALSDPSAPDPAPASRLARFPSLRVREVILGFVIENGASRWLTDEEISRGVLEAIEADRIRTIVGTVHPWSMRP
jgi:hypothetical protein